MKIPVEIVVELYQGVVQNAELFFSTQDALDHLSHSIENLDLIGVDKLTTVDDFERWKSANYEGDMPDQEFHWFVKQIVLGAEEEYS
jgi:hypothetical protein